MSEFVGYVSISSDRILRAVDSYVKENGASGPASQTKIPELRVLADASVYSGGTVNCNASIAAFVNYWAGFKK